MNDDKQSFRENPNHKIMRLNKNDFAKDTKKNSEEILKKISIGRAVLFTGAGFSVNTTNIQNRSPLQSKELTKKLCEIGEFEYEDDLGYISDRFKESKGSATLIDLLKNEYTLKGVSSEHTNICSINWLRFYTTNYDNSIEMSCTKSDKKINNVDSNSDMHMYGRDLLCVHLNGYINSLSEDTLEKGFKLTDSSYVSSNPFIDHSWKNTFKRDLTRSSAIVFVGYSMSDFDIKKVLIKNKNLKSKTYFIVAENPSEKETFVLSKYGNIIPIGINGFARLIINNKSLFENNNNYQLQAIHPYEFSEVVQERNISQNEIKDFLMYGRIDKEFIDEAITREQTVPYIINRELLNQVSEHVSNHSNVIILSEFGNGKSVFLKQLKPYLLSKSISVCELTDIYADYISDIEEMSKHITKKYTLILDDYERYIDLIEHCCHLNINNVTFVLSSRFATHEVYKKRLTDMNFSYCKLSINYLSENEIKDFTNIIGTLGLWGGIINNQTRYHKQDFIKSKNNSQISKTLLTLIDSPTMKQRVKKLLTNMCHSDCKDTVFLISLLNILNLRTGFGLISEVADNNHIYDNNMLSDTSFKQLFTECENKDLEIKPVSSLFCKYLIQNFFSTHYILEQLLRIAKLFDLRHKSFEQEIIFKNMLKFSFVEKIFPDTNKRNTLIRYYENLKINIRWLEHDPHFWLQFGMSCITYKDYPTAQIYFDNAYSLAKKKLNYHTKYIDTQQARLFILQSIENNDIDYFNKAQKIFLTLENDKYKFSQLQLYKKYFKSHCYISFPGDNQITFQRSCIVMLNSIKSNRDRSDIDTDRIVQIFEVIIDEFKDLYN